MMKPSIVDTPELREVPEVETKSAKADVATKPAQFFDEKFPGLSKEFGSAILDVIDENGVLWARDIGEDFFAAALGDKGSPEAPTVFLPLEQRFYTYSPAEGIFAYRRDPVLLTQLSRWLLECVWQCRDHCETRMLEFRLRGSNRLSGVLRKARGLLEVPPEFFSSDLKEFIPCANRVLRLSDKTLLSFSPAYCRRNKLAVPYDPRAKCPLFLDTLMRPALDADELDLLQRACGLFLIGENLAQRILLLIGTAGGGKGTFIRVLRGMLERTMSARCARSCCVNDSSWEGFSAKPCFMARTCRTTS